MEHRTPKEMQEISLRIEHHDDIFSDFDIRPYSRRALSVDFIEEIKRASHDKNGGEIELILHLPEKERNEYHESVIRERLMAHFKKHHQMLAKEKAHVLKVGLSMSILGVICMIIASFAVFEDTTNNFGLSFLVVFLEPAAWFLLWEGMDQIIFNSKNINPNLNFYRKMVAVQGHIHFASY